MEIFEAVMIAEGAYMANEEKTIEAWQLLIDTRTVWKLQGSFGRKAMELIENGICTQEVLEK